MDITLVEVLINGFVTITVALGSAWIAKIYYKTEVQEATVEVEEAKSEVRDLRNELSFRDEALSFPLEPWQFLQLQKLLAGIMDEETGEVDRFFVLKAFNGVNDPQWTTAICSIVDGKYVKYDYVRFPLDDHYKDLLKRLRRGENVLLDVEHLIRCALKTLYESEAIVSSLLAHIIDILLSDKKTVSITYASFASHRVVLSEATQMQCTLITNILSDWARSNDIRRKVTADIIGSSH